MKWLPLTKGYETVIDDLDYERVGKYKWKAEVITQGDRVYVYAVRNFAVKGVFHSEKLHRVILNRPVGMLVDHINRDTLDNRRSNLRAVTFSQNTMNQKLSVKNVSGYRGVSGKEGKWVAAIKVRGQTRWLGRFKDKLDAAVAYDMAALMLNGEFAQTSVLKPLIQERKDNFLKT